jgi:hypothetical protein
MKKTLFEIEADLPYEVAQERAIASHGTVTHVRRQAALDLARDGETDPPLIKDLSKALKAESDALRNLEAARTARDAAAIIQDEWTLLIEQLTALNNRFARGSQQIEEARANADALRAQVKIDLGGSGFVDVQALAGNVARLENAVPIMESALAALKADLENQITQMRQFANQHGVPREVVP